MTHTVLPLAITAGICTALGAFFAAGRFYVRGILLKSLKWDDYWLGLALIFGFVSYGVIMTFTFRDIPHMTLASNSSRFNSYYFDFGNLNVAAMSSNTLQNMCSRLSLLCSYRRFTPREHVCKVRWRALNTLAVLSAVFGILFTYLEIAPCYPVHIMYYPNDPWQYKRGAHYTCLPPRVPFWWSALVGLALDLGIYMMPFWLLWKASFIPQKRWDVYALFAFGAIVYCLSVARIPLIADVLVSRQGLFTVDVDKMILMWLITIVESNCIVIAASVPTLRPLANMNRVKMQLESAKKEYKMQNEEGGGRFTPPPMYRSSFS